MVSEHSTTIGMDLGDRQSDLCVIENDSGDVIERCQIPTTRVGVERYFGRAPIARVVFEVGTHSGWVGRLVASLGHEVVIADARKARSLMGDEEKDDDLDAEFLARMGRADPKLLKPIKHRSQETQCNLAMIRSRAALVRARTLLVNHVRGIVKASGYRLPSCSTRRFHKLLAELPEALQDSLSPTMASVAELTEQIKNCERNIEKSSRERYPETERLRQVAGVGPITALAYVLIIEDPHRFRRSRSVGSYLGLCRKRWKSGKSDPDLRISKAGDRLMRSLLVGSAQYILGPFGPDSDLKRWGQAYAARGGKNAKKRAVVAVARKLAVLLHRLWVSDEDYEPLRNSQRREQQAANGDCSTEVIAAACS